MRSELDLYLEEAVLPRTPSFDVLGWWKSNAPKYPTLQAIARDLLAIPVSTIASESAFSASGRLASPHRIRLHPKTLEALICIQSWLWASEIQGIQFIVFYFFNFHFIFFLIFMSRLFLFLFFVFCFFFSR